MHPWAMDAASGIWGDEDFGDLEEVERILAEPPEETEEEQAIAA